MLVLILGKSRGKRASLQKLHFLAHSIRTSQNRVNAQQVFAHERRPSEFLIRVEPWLNRAIAYAKAIGLVSLEGGKSLQLSETGQAFFDQLSADSSLFLQEKDFLQLVSRSATERAIEQIMRMEQEF